MAVMKYPPQLKINVVFKSILVVTKIFGAWTAMNIFNKQTFINISILNTTPAEEFF